MGREKARPTRYPGVGRSVKDNRFIVRATAIDEKTGKLKEKEKKLKAGATIEDALAELAELKDRIRRGIKASGRVEIPTLAAYVPSWSAKRLSSGSWNAHGGTVETVAQRLDNYVLPHFGDWLIDRITYGDVRDWLHELAHRISSKTKRPLSATYRAGIYTHLRCIVDDARADLGLPEMSWPPAPKTDKGAKPSLDWNNYEQVNQGLALTPAQLAVFLSKAEELDPHGWYPMAVLGFGSDARFSEVTSCMVGDIDADRDDGIGVWLVRRHWIKDRKADAPGSKNHPEGEVKYLDATTTGWLRPHWLKRRLHGKTALMFPPSARANGAMRRSHQGFQLFLNRVADATGLPRMTSKVMRRTYLTLSHLDALADSLTQAQAGHATPQQTMAYVKPTAEARKEHARKMADVLYLPTGTDGEDPDG